MNEYRTSSHAKYKLHVHLIWVTKYRKKVLRGDIAARVRELTREICRSNDVEIIKGHVSIDHVHVLVSMPPYLSVSKLVQYIKGKTSRKIFQEFTEIRKKYWGQHMWARGYFAASSGNVTDDVIKAYIEQQDIEKEDDFRISDP